MPWSSPYVASLEYDIGLGSLKRHSSALIRGSEADPYNIEGSFPLLLIDVGHAALNRQGLTHNIKGARILIPARQT